MIRVHVYYEGFMVAKRTQVTTNTHLGNHFFG